MRVQKDLMLQKIEFHDLGVDYQKLKDDGFLT